MTSTLVENDERPSQEQTTAIAANHKITDVNGLYQLLGSLASYYARAEAAYEMYTNARSTKRSLEGVQNAAEKLIAKIDQLNEYENTLLWWDLHKPPTKSADRTFFNATFGEMLSKSGSEENVEPEPEDGRAYLSKLDYEDVMAIVTRLQKTAKSSVDNMVASPNGRKGKYVLHELICQLHEYWTQSLSRSFTFDEHEGEGITPAYYFCVDVAQAIDPSVTPTEVNTQMRSVVAENHGK